MKTNLFWSPYFIPVLFVAGFIFYYILDPLYYYNIVMSGGAYKFMSAISGVGFLICIISMSVGIYAGNASSITKILSHDENEHRFYVKLRQVTRLIVILSAIMLFLSHYIQGDLIEKIVSGDLNNFKDSFEENASLSDKLILTLRHLIYIWGASLFLEPSKVRLWELFEIIFTSVVIGLLTQSRLMVVTLIVVLLVSYARTTYIKSKILLIFIGVIFTFLGMITFVRSYAFSGEFNSESFEFILIEILRYFITPYGYSHAIIELSAPNFEYGFQQLFSFFLISIGKFMGLFDESINMSYVRYISDYYYPSLNQIGAVGSIVFGFGIVFSQPIFFLIGYVLGYFYKRYTRGGPISVIFYPILYAFALDLIRFPSLFSGAVPTCLLYIAVFRLSWKACNNITRSRISI